MQIAVNQEQVIRGSAWETERGIRENDRCFAWAPCVWYNLMNDEIKGFRSFDDWLGRSGESHEGSHESIH